MKKMLIGILIIVLVLASTITAIADDSDYYSGSMIFVSVCCSDTVYQGANDGFLMDDNDECTKNGSGISYKSWFTGVDTTYRLTDKFQMYHGGYGVDYRPGFYGDVRLTIQNYYASVCDHNLDL